MVTGIEAAGLALAILPLLMNQLDAYARGIEKIKLLRGYRREFADYSMGLGTQRAILINTLEQALEGVVDDEYEVSQLISNPQSDAWEDPVLQKRLRTKLGRNYDVFLANTTALSELLERISRKLKMSATDMKSPTNEVREILKFRKVLSKAVYDDLLSKVDATNTILKTLVDQSTHQEETRKRRQPWTRLLQRSQKARKHAEGLFKTIIGGKSWKCGCKEHHCVHLQLQTNPLGNTGELPDADSQSRFRMIFSNTNTQDTARSWSWMEVVVEPTQVEDIVTITNLSLDENKQHTPHKPRVRFDIPPVEAPKPLEAKKEPSPAPQIQDLCSSLCVAENHVEDWETIGSVSSECDSTIQYTMHAVKSLQYGVPQKSLREVLSQLSRRNRLHIAAGLACGVIQLHGNWLKSQWDSSDVHLVVDNSAHNTLLDSLYFSWPLSTPSAKGELPSLPSSIGTGNTLRPLGLALIELSLGKSLAVFLAPEDKDQNGELTSFNTVSRLVKMVFDESGTRYAEAVNCCLSWSGLGSLCYEGKRFEERVFDTIVSPILKDLLIFENLV